MITLYHSDPTSGEVFDTIEVNTPQEKEFRMSVEGGLWWETPRWHRNPRPHGFDPSNPYERPVHTPYQEFPRTMHKKMSVDPQTKQPVWKTLTVKDDEAKETALKGGYLLVPNEEQHKQMMTA